MFFRNIILLIFCCCFLPKAFGEITKIERCISVSAEFNKVARVFRELAKSQVEPFFRDKPTIYMILELYPDIVSREFKIKNTHRRFFQSVKPNHANFNLKLPNAFDGYAIDHFKKHQSGLNKLGLNIEDTEDYIMSAWEFAEDTSGMTITFSEKQNSGKFFKVDLLTKRVLVYTSENNFITYYSLDFFKNDKISDIAFEKLYLRGVD